MTLNAGFRSGKLGVEERRDEAPRAGRSQAPSDPEVVAKPKRRFTAAYRLPGSGGGGSLHTARRARLLVAVEGCHSSFASDGLVARRERRARCGSWPRRSAARNRPRRNPLDERARGASELAWSTSYTPRTRSWTCGKSVRAAGIEPRTRNALLIAVQPLAAQVGVTSPACQALGVSRATVYRRQRSTPAPAAPSNARGAV